MAFDWRKVGGKVWREWIRGFLVVLAIVGSFRSAVADWNDVPTGSMKPTILEGDRIFVNKLAYDLRVPFTFTRLAQWGDPQRGDIVVLFSPRDGNRLVKRVVGLPGDRLAMRNNRVYINGEPLEYEPLAGEVEARVKQSPLPDRAILAEEQLGERRHVVMALPSIGTLRTFGPIEVPAGHYFVMGDNRDNSSDSRVFGFVPRGKIVGEATAVAASLDPQRHYLPRWKRFFRKLY